MNRETSGSFVQRENIVLSLEDAMNNSFAVSHLVNTTEGFSLWATRNINMLSRGLLEW